MSRFYKILIPTGLFIFGLAGCGDSENEEKTNGDEEAAHEQMNKGMKSPAKIYDQPAENAGLSVFEEDGKFGLKDAGGEEVLPAEYDFVRNVEGWNIAWIGTGTRLDSTDEKLTAGGDYQLVNAAGEILTREPYKDIGEFRNGVCWVEVWKDADPNIPNDFGVRRGLINSKGELVVDLIYPDIQPFNDNGLARIGVFDRKLLAQSKKLNFNIDPIYSYNYGFIDTKGEIVVEPKFDFLSPHFFDGRCVAARIVMKDGYPENVLYGFIDEEGKVVIDMMYGSANGFVEGKAEVYSLDGQLRILDTNGNCLEGCPES